MPNTDITISSMVFLHHGVTKEQDVTLAYFCIHPYEFFVKGQNFEVGITFIALKLCATVYKLFAGFK